MRSAGSAHRIVRLAMRKGDDVSVLRHRMSAAVIGLIAPAFLLSGCGTRVERQSSSSLPAQDSAVQAASSDPAGESVPAVGDPTAPTAGSAGVASPSATAPGPTAAGPAKRAVTATTGLPKSAADAAADRGGGPASTGSAAAPKPPTSGGPGPAPVAPATRSPLLLASVGSYSGPAGSALLPMLQGAQVWVTHINSRGGVNGHPVKLFVYDDGFDPARHRAQIQEAVERRKVLAFLQNGETQTGGSSVDYVTEKRIPVIGITGGESWAYSSPMYFPQLPSANFQLDGAPPSVARMLVPRGVTKIGTIVCVEIPECSNGERVWSNSAKRVGMEYIYRAKASLTQPDFTAECLAARNAGAQSLFVLMDPNTVGRIAASCARQNSHPTIALMGTALAAFMERDPNLDGLVAHTTIVPWFTSGTPATDEFQSAMAQFGKDVSPYTAVWGWVSGKLLEKAGANLPEPPTTAAILDGLWSIKDDTLGGMTMPLTFVRDEKPKGLACGYDIFVQKGRWVSPDNSALHCQ